jgi:hypothetical protein
MTEKSYPFSSGQGASVSESDWSAMVGTWQDEGVHGNPFGNELKVVPGVAQNTIQINAGPANIGGFYYNLTAPKVVPTTENLTAVDRVDLVVLRLDRTARQILPEIHVGKTMADLAVDEIPLSEWTQLRSSVATSTNWGSAADKRWFAGARVRPSLADVEPPVVIGGLIHKPSEDGSQGEIYIGEEVAGVPTWVPWVVSQQLDTGIVPTAWTAYGHSYLNWVNGVQFQTGRTDALFREALNTQFNAWTNFAVSGARLLWEGRSSGGWPRVMQENTHVVHGAPYYSEGGGHVLVFGINDLGYFSAGQTSQVCAAYSRALTAVISRLRASVVFENDYLVGTRTTYGSGFTVQTGTTNWCSGASVHRTLSTTGATVTMTLPTDYSGEPIAIQWITTTKSNDGTVTYSGTAGFTGTLVLDNDVAADNFASTHTPIITRITNLTSAAAGKTIVATVSALGSGSTAIFDCWWLEAKAPPPVIVANVPRVISYAAYSDKFGDADVATLNSTIDSTVASFDGMVQVADLDAAINKRADWFSSDGFHPNELGASAAAGALVAAVRSLQPTAPDTPALNLVNSTPIAGTIRKPRTPGFFYTTDVVGPIVNETFVNVGDLYAMPFVVTEGRERYNRLGLRVGALPVSGITASTFRWGLYDDPKWKGYPQCLLDEATNISGPLSTGTTVGGVLSPASGTGSLFYALDPGLYWIALKVVTKGTVMLEMYTGQNTFGIFPSMFSNMDDAHNKVAWIVPNQGTGVLPTVWPGDGYSPLSDRAPRVALQLA